MPKQLSKEKSLKLSKYQKFEAKTISRKDIKNAPYNPRKIDNSSREKLKKKIKEVGLIDTLVWNKRTGNLVGGHQRIDILDGLERKKDYLLTVAVCDLDEKTEREMNVFLNNPDVMGQWDFEALKDVITADEVKIDVEQLGFDDMGVQFLFQEGIFEEDRSEKMGEDVGKLNEIKQEMKDIRKKMEEKDDAEFFVVVVFQKRAECDDFLKQCGLPPGNRYIDGKRLKVNLGIGDVK